MCINNCIWCFIVPTLSRHMHACFWKDCRIFFGHLLCKRSFPKNLKLSFSLTWKWRTSAPPLTSFSCRRLAWGPKAAVITFTCLAFTSVSWFITWSCSSHKQVLWSVKITRTCIEMSCHHSDAKLNTLRQIYYPFLWYNGNRECWIHFLISTSNYPWW